MAAMLWAGGLLMSACSSGGATHPTATSRPPSTPAAPSSSTTTLPTEAGLLSDEPCTRSVAAPGSLPARVGLRLDDLEHMVLSRDDVGGLSGFESDMSRHGYWGNDEIRYMEVNPPSTCDDTKRFGRIVGFANAYEPTSRVRRQVTFSVHLFWRESDARAWVDSFTNAIKASVGTPDGPARFDAQPVTELGPNAVLADDEGHDGVRTWVMFVRGPIVGWVTDLHPRGSRPSIDVTSTATTMAARVEKENTDAAARPAGPSLDAAGLISAPLPLAELGPRFAGLRWDWFLGGCSDTEERAANIGEQAAVRSAGFGRVVGCTSMYDPQEDTSRDVARVFTSVQFYNDDKGASADLADLMARSQAAGAQRFDPGSIGDEAFGMVTPPTGSDPYPQTRITFRIGNLIAIAGVQDKAPRDANGEITALALKLHARIEGLLRGTNP